MFHEFFLPQAFRVAAEFCTQQARLLLVGCGCLSVFGSGCSVVPKTKVALPSQFIPAQSPTEKVVLLGFDQAHGDAVRTDIEAYFAKSKSFEVVFSGRSVNDKTRQDLLKQYHPDLVLIGDSFEAGCSSDATDRAISIRYFTFFVITSPIALGIGLGSSWEAKAYASAHIRVLSTRTDEQIWNRERDLVVTERGKSVVSHSTIEKAVLPLVRRNLVTEMLDEFVAAYTKRKTSQANDRR